MHKNKEYIFMWSTAPIMSVYWAAPQIFKDGSNFFPATDIFQYYDGKIITTYIPKICLDSWRKTESKKYLNPAYFKKYRFRYQKARARWWRWILQIEKKSYARATEAQLKKDHFFFQEYMNEAIAYFGSTRTEFTYAAEQRLEKILKKYAKKEWQHAFNILATSPKIDDVQKEHLARRKLLSSKITDKALLQHASQFPWFIFGQFSEKKVIAFLKKSIRRERTDYRSELKSLQRKKKELKEQQEELYAKIGKERKEAMYLAAFLQTQAVERMNIKAYWSGCYYLARNMWQSIADVLSLDIGDVVIFVTPPEIQALLDNTYADDIQKIISVRKKSFAIDYTRGGKIQIVNGKEADRLFEKRIHTARGQRKIIKGQSASLGMYQGKVRKVIPGDLEMLQASIRNFKKGEVLVTSMTQPNMMVIANKAGAIVTDEGGITSHAAVISRELNIPCIVGCLHAMQSLKDGDIVEVDANKGIVKIIKRAKV